MDDHEVRAPHDWIGDLLADARDQVKRYPELEPVLRAGIAYMEAERDRLNVILEERHQAYAARRQEPTDWVQYARDLMEYRETGDPTPLQKYMPKYLVDATEGHMERWAAGEETHVGEERS